MDDATKSYLYQVAYQATAIVKLAALPRIWTLPEADAAVALAGLVDAGLVDLWPERKALVLSAAAVARLDLEAVIDARGRHVWYDRGSPSSERAKQASGRTVKRPKMVLETDLAGNEEAYTLDDLPGPTSCELAETAQPTLLLGIGMIWPGPSVEQKVNGRCRGCGHLKRCPSIAYCVICCRSGNHRLRTPVLPEAQPAKVGNAHPVRTADPTLAGGVGSRPKGRKQGKKTTVKSAN
jgi:hypothetical protein